MKAIVHFISSNILKMLLFLKKSSRSFFFIHLILINEKWESEPSNKHFRFLFGLFFYYTGNASTFPVFFQEDYEESIVIVRCMGVYYLKILICWLIISYLKIGVENFNARSASETVSFSKVPVKGCDFSWLSVM